MCDPLQFLSELIFPAKFYSLPDPMEEGYEVFS
jgi:hypothetical protein